jgi:hypothetical protein
MKCPICNHIITDQNIQFCPECGWEMIIIPNNASEQLKKYYENKKRIFSENRKPLRIIRAMGLVAYYPFNGNTNDESGYGNHGTVKGATLTADRKGKANSAYSFGGYHNSAAIMVTNSASLQFTNEMSISFWYKLNGYDGMDDNGNYVEHGYHTLIARDGDRGGFYLTCHYDKDKKSIIYCGRNVETNVNWQWENPVFGKSSIGEWVHITIVSNSIYDELFINGVSASKGFGSSQEILSQANSRDMYFGRFAFSADFLSDSIGGWYPLNGAMDEIRIYNRTLHVDEIQTLYNE